MIIDFHTHIYPDKIAQSTINTILRGSDFVPASDGTKNGLLKNMSVANVDVSINLPVLTKPSQFDSVAKFAIGLNEEFNANKKGILSFAGFHPDCDNIKDKIKYLVSNGIKGIKIHPDYQNTYIDDDRYYNILKEAKDNGLVVVTHSGVDSGYVGKPIKCPPEKVLKIIERLGGYDKFVLAHFGGKDLAVEVFSLLAGKNLYFDTALALDELPKSLFEKIVYKHGADKILFATDSPWISQLKYVDIIKSYDFDKVIEDKILYKNALNLLDIKEQK